MGAPISEPTRRASAGAITASSNAPQIHGSTTGVISSRSHLGENGKNSLTPYTLVRSRSRCDATPASDARYPIFQAIGFLEASRTISSGSKAITGAISRECVRCRWYFK